MGVYLFILCLRRTDLEIVNIEGIWVGIRLHSKHLLVGTFYRPPKSDNTVLADSENSKNSVVVTGISDFIILGDLNLDIN